MTNPYEKHQVKSRWYYIFWGIATVTVFAGQVYVGSGYREMAKQTEEMAKVLSKPVPYPTVGGNPAFTCP